MPPFLPQDPEKAALLELDRRQLSLEQGAAPSVSRTLLRRTVLALFALVVGTAVWSESWRSAASMRADTGTGGCEQFPPRTPPPDEALDATRDFVFGSYLNTSVRILQGLVQVE